MKAFEELVCMVHVLERKSINMRCERGDSRATSEGDVAMKSGNRAELLEAVAELCEKHPNWRLGQLIANVAGWADQGVWDVEVEQLFEAARLYLHPVEEEAAEAVHSASGVA